MARGASHLLPENPYPEAERLGVARDLLADVEASGWVVALDAAGRVTVTVGEPLSEHIPNKAVMFALGKLIPEITALVGDPSTTAFH